jgi:hypothetical protein
MILKHLIEKYSIFAANATVDDSNCIIDENDISVSVELYTKKKTYTEKEYLKIVNYVLSNYKCYRVSDTDFNSRLTDPKPIVEEYKKYKQACVQYTKPAEYMLDPDLNTMDTYYIDTLCVTSELLIAKFGPMIRTGTDTDKHRYEYKFIYDNTLFSLYDWKTNGEFEKEYLIKWHLASNRDLTQKEINEFKKFIKACC